MKPDEPGGVFIVAHFRRRPLRDPHQARGEISAGRYDRASRTVNPALHPNVYNALHSPAMDVATGREPRPWAPEQAGASIGAELMPPKPDRGPRSGSNEPADITDHAFLTTGTAPTPHNPLSAAGELHKAAYEESSGHEDDEPAA
jgi:hypothetical protein